LLVIDDAGAFRGVPNSWHQWAIQENCATPSLVSHDALALKLLNIGFPEIPLTAHGRYRTLPALGRGLPNEKREKA